MTLLRRRAARRSCLIHGDNGCEIQGEAGPVTRALEKRRWRAEVELDIGHLLSPLPGLPN